MWRTPGELEQRSILLLQCVLRHHVNVEGGESLQVPRELSPEEGSVYARPYVFQSRVDDYSLPKVCLDDDAMWKAVAGDQTEGGIAGLARSDGLSSFGPDDTMVKQWVVQFAADRASSGSLDVVRAATTSGAIPPRELWIDGTVNVYPEFDPAWAPITLEHTWGPYSRAGVTDDLPGFTDNRHMTRLLVRAHAGLVITNHANVFLIASSQLADAEPYYLEFLVATWSDTAAAAADRTLEDVVIYAYDRRSIPQAFAPRDVRLARLVRDTMAKAVRGADRPEVSAESRRQTITFAKVAASVRMSRVM